MKTLQRLCGVNAKYMASKLFFNFNLGTRQVLTRIDELNNVLDLKTLHGVPGHILRNTNFWSRIRKYFAFGASNPILKQFRGQQFALHNFGYLTAYNQSHKVEIFLELFIRFKVLSLLLRIPFGPIVSETSWIEFCYNFLKIPSRKVVTWLRNIRQAGFLNWLIWNFTLQEQLFTKFCNLYYQAPADQVINDNLFLYKISAWDTHYPPALTLSVALVSSSGRAVGITLPTRPVGDIQSEICHREMPSTGHPWWNGRETKVYRSSV